jgi:hypothetical protein
MMNVMRMKTRMEKEYFYGFFFEYLYCNHKLVYRTSVSHLPMRIGLDWIGCVGVGVDVDVDLGMRRASFD